MICGLEIGLAIFGILALVRGKMTLSKNKIVVGIPARLLGLVALTPLPVALVAVLAFTAAKDGFANPDKFAEDNRGAIAGIEAGTVIVIALFVFLVGAIIGVSPAEAKRRERGSRNEDDYDDQDDERDDHDGRRRRDRDDDHDDDHDKRERGERDNKPWNR